MRIDILLFILLLFFQGSPAKDSAIERIQAVTDSAKVINCKFERIIMKLDSIKKAKDNLKNKTK